MKHLTKFNEVLRTKGMTPEQESELIFEEAYLKGSSSPNLMYLNKDWEKISKKYRLYDDYYLYKDAILYLKSVADYSWELIRLKDDTATFKQKIYDRIEELEIAFSKLY